MHFDLTWCIFLLISLAGRGQMDDSEHLCSKVMNGDFERLKLKSITYYSIDQLIIFEGNKKYIIDEKRLSYSRLPIPNKNFRWDTEEIERAVEDVKIKGVQPEFVYLLSLGDVGNFWDFFTHHFTWHTSKMTKRMALNIVMKENEYLMDIHGWFATPRLADPTVFMNSLTRVHPDYAIIARQQYFAKRDDNNHLTWPQGYVIHKDQFKNTGQFIMYDLVVDHEPIKLHIQKLPSFQEATILPYYFIQRTNEPNEVLLLYKDQIDNSNQPERSLFKRLPVGYRYGTYNFFFDTELACVYRMDFDQKLSKLSRNGGNQSNYKGMRTNIPFEKFFSCDADRFPLNPSLAKKYPPDRCETNYLSYKGFFKPPKANDSKNPGNKDIVDNDHADHEKKWDIFIIAGAILGGFILVLAGMCLYLACCRGNNEKKDNEQNDKKNITSKHRVSNSPSQVVSQIAEAQQRKSGRRASRYLPNDINFQEDSVSTDPPRKKKGTPKKGSTKTNSPKKRAKKRLTQKHTPEPSLIDSESSDHRQASRKKEKLPATSAFNQSETEHHRSPKRKKDTPVTMSTCLY